MIHTGITAGNKTCTQEILCLDAPFEVKKIQETGLFEGYAAVFNAVDHGMDRVARGAFRRSLRERGIKGVKLLWQHDPTEPIGIIEALREDMRGLFVRARLLPDIRRAREALTLLQTAALDGLSIGFKTVAASHDERNGVRTLTDVDLWEISLVTFPMQDAARVQQVKARDIQTIRQFEHFLRDAGFTRREAKAIAATGFAQRDAGPAPVEEPAVWPDVIASLWRTIHIIEQCKAR